MEYAGTQENGSDAELGHLAPEHQVATAVAARTGGIPLLPDANNVVLLPEGATLDDISVRGRDLVITLDDGSVYVVADGAVFVPQIVIDGVSVPPMNLAALLTSDDPQPAAGPVSSSGGNFAEAVNPIQDAFKLGNLLPYTELSFPEPRKEEIFPGDIDRDEEPTVSIITPNQPAGVQAAAVTVHEAGLSARGDEPAGSDAQSDSETTSGTIAFAAPDGLASISLNGVAITGVGQTFTTDHGVLTITSIADGVIGYSYTLADNVLGPPTDEVFIVTVTDKDGDTANASLTITILDDAPIARPDVDSVTEDGPLVADGNVLTGTGGSDANPSDGVADTQGADGAVVATTGTFVGQYGTLVLHADGSYVYTLDNANPQVQGLTEGQTLTEVFPYTLRDGDGDTSQTTLTITINGANDGVTINGLDVTGGEIIVDEDNLASGSSPDADALTQHGTFTVTTPDGLADVTVGGVLVVSGGVFTPQIIITPQGVLTITGFTPASGAGGVTGGTFTYSYELTVNSPTHGASGQDSVSDSFPVVVTDSDGSSANASLDVTVIDDVPTAHDDTAVSVAEDFAGTVGGNVMANDIQGADGATLTSVTINGTTTAIAAVGSTTVTTVNGVYVFTANGHWTFDPAPGLNDAAGVNPSFTYVITDGDGDQATATQPITITDGDGPTAGAPIALALDDQNLATGSTPTGPDSATASIAFTPGSDAIASIVFGTDLSELASDLTWTRISDTQITGSDGSRLVVTLDLVREGDSAQVTATLNGNYAGHADIDIDDVAVLGSVGVVATDTDGDTATGTVNLSVSDDVPAISTTDALIKVTVDESDFTYDASANFANAFSFTYGADGAGSVAYALTVTAGPSGLVDTVSGQPVVLSLTAGGVVEGRNANGDLVFTVTVDVNGVVTLDQSRAVQHGDATDPDDAATLSAADLVRLTATVTDGDGDHASASIDIGDKLLFRDASPMIYVEVVDGDTVLLTTQDAQTIGNASDTSVSSANFGGAFSVVYPGYGADGAGSVVWNFALSVTNPTSGLSSNGAAINLFLVDGVVVGSTAASAGQINAGNTIFTLATDASGVVTLTQNAEIDHAGPGGTAPYDGQLAVLGNGLVQLSGTATITDGDGDTARDTEHLDLGGNIRFADDGPAISASVAVPQLTVDETVLGTDAHANFANAFTVHPGADGAGSVTYALTVTEGLSGLVDLATGQPVVLSLTTSGVVEGRNYSGALMFTVSVDANGTVTLDQQRTLLHSDSSNPDDAVTLSAAGLVRLTATVTDGDGDHASTSIDIGDRLVFKDDGPVAVADAPLTIAETAGLTAGTNLLLNDTLGADGGRLTHVSFDGVHWIGIDQAGTSIPVSGLGIYTFKGNGDWTFDPTENSSASNQDGGFQYQITDNDGDKSVAHQAVTVTNADSPLLIVGSNDTDITGNGSQHTVPTPGGATTGVLVGSAANDILVGDPGGVKVSQAQSANFVLVLDSSGSMSNSIQFEGSWTTRMDALKDATKSLIDDLAHSGGANVRITVIDFDTNATNKGTFDLIVNGVVQTGQIALAKAAVNGLVAEDGTNFEAALQSASNWINGSSGIVGADVNKVVFVSDGNPTHWVTSNGTGGTGQEDSDNVTSSMNQVLGSDTTNEPRLILNAGYTIEAVGINANSSLLARLDDVEDGIAGSSGGGAATNVNSAEDIRAVLTDIAGIDTPFAASADRIDGGAGNDIIFGDVLFTDQLATQTGVALDPGSGWAVFSALEGRTNAENLDPAGNGGDWTREDTLAYIRANHAALSAESGRTGGNDTIFGGAGSDIIYGQEGNDTIDGGDGDDFLDGGSGADTISGGAGADTLYGQAGNDTLNGGDGNDILSGGAGGDTLTGGNGSDTFIIASGQSSAVLGGSGNAGTIAGYDRITDFSTTLDRLDLNGTPRVAANTEKNGTNSDLTINGEEVSSHRIENGIITFDDRSNFNTALTLTTTVHLAAVVDYLQHNDLGNGGTTVAFKVGTSTYIYQQVGNTPNEANDILVELANTDILNLTSLIGSRITPVVFDLDGDGVEFIGTSAKVTFDYADGYGHVGTAWAAADDGILAIDRNGDGVVNDGTEIVFATATNGAATDLAGLAIDFDSNHDSVLDANDAEFSKFGVWQDANSNGVTDAGEFRSLAAMGITSINLNSDKVTYTAADGDVLVHGSGTYQKADGSTGLLADAAFSVDRQAREAGEAGRAVETAAVAAAASVLIAATLAADVPPAQAAVDHAPVSQSLEATLAAPLVEAAHSQAPESHSTGDLLSDTSAPAALHTPESTVGEDAAQDTPAEMASPVDHADIAPVADNHPSDAGAALVHALGEGAGTMQAVEALLALQAPPSSHDSTPGDAQLQPTAAPVVEEALADARGAAFIDTLIDRLGGSADHTGRTEHHPGTDIAQALSAHVDGGTVMVQSAFDLAQMAHDASAQAAAAHV